MVSPDPASGDGEITLRFDASDLEGDVNELCIGIALSPDTPELHCIGITPPGMTVNGPQSTHPNPVGGLAPGDYTVGLGLRDRAGNTSNTATVDLTVS